VNAVGALAAGPPQLGPSWATAVGAADARLNAEVSPNGLATTARFEYIAAAAYQANLEATPPREPFTGALGSPAGPPTPIGAGSAFQAFSRQLGGLAPNTAYRYRFVAVNSAGTSRGPAQAFTTTELAPVFSLPDGRGWEMVSPPAKNGGQVAAPEEIFGGGVLQAAVGGGAVTFGSTASFAAASGAPGVSQYVSRRSPSGWTTENVTLPLLSGSYDTSTGAGAPYRLFSTDLATALVTNGKRCRVVGAGGCPVANPPLPGSGAATGYRNYYLRDNSGDGFTALLDGVDLAGQVAADFEVTLVAATPDLRRALLSSCAALTADAVEVPGSGGECDPSATNLYLWSGGSLRLINVLPGQGQGAPGAEVAAQAGAISADGSRVYWADRASGDLYLRDGGRTVPVDASGNAEFQAASEDGSVAFFLAEGHLYRYTVAA
jgi:hypothetical protein